MKINHPTSISIVLLCLVLGACAPLQPTVQPLPVNLNDYPSVVVTDFDGEHGKDLSLSIEQALTQVKPGGQQPRFHIMPRDRLQKVILEQNLQLAGVIDSTKVSQIGKEVGVDAIISGSVTTMRVTDYDFSQTRTKVVRCETTKTKQCPVEIQVPCKRRTAYLAFTSNIIEIRTGTIKATDVEDLNVEAQFCKGDEESVGAGIVNAYRDRVPYDIPEKIMNEAVRRGTAKFVAKITTYTDPTRIADGVRAEVRLDKSSGITGKEFGAARTLAIVFLADQNRAFGDTLASECQRLARQEHKYSYLTRADLDNGTPLPSLNQYLLKAREKGIELIIVGDRVDIGPTGSVTAVQATIYGGTLHPEKALASMTAAYDKEMSVNTAATELAKICVKE